MAAILDKHILLNFDQQSFVHCTHSPVKPPNSHQNHWYGFILYDLGTVFKNRLFMAAILDLLIMLKVQRNENLFFVFFDPWNQNIDTKSIDFWL